jgi:hypothetical protein
MAIWPIQPKSVYLYSDSWGILEGEDMFQVEV